MKLYHLYPKNIDKWAKKYPTHKEGTSWGAVVVAPNKKEARRVASEAGGKAWLNPKTSICEEVITSEYVVPCLILDQIP